MQRRNPEIINEKEKLALENFSDWNQALTEKDSNLMANFYSEKATFLPTVSGEFKKGQTGAKEYFDHFLEKNPFGKIIESEVQMLGENSYLHSGMYDFELGPQEERQTVSARFSFVWEKNNAGEWKIIHHHSSIKPE